MENGLKVNYSLFYKYDNFLNKLRSCSYLFNKSIPYTRVDGKENLTFGTQFSYKLKDNTVLNSVGMKYVLNEQGLKVNQTVNLKGFRDVFDNANVSLKANVIFFYLYFFIIKGRKKH